MRPFTLLSVIASAAISLVAAEELSVEVTKAVECTRKTEKGDTVSMHYRGTLADSGKQFDASTLISVRLASWLGSYLTYTGRL